MRAPRAARAPMAPHPVTGAASRARRAGAERPGLRYDRARRHRLAGVSGVSATNPDPLLAPAHARRHRGHGPPRRPSPAPGACAVGPSTGSRVPVSRCCPCRATPPTCHRSNPAGPSSRRCFAPLSRARSRPSKNRSSRPSTPSLPKMPRAGSAIAGMLCQAKPKTALILQPEFIGMGSSFPVGAAGVLLMAPPPYGPGEDVVGIRRARPY